jgi:hypothetical protein
MMQAMDMRMFKFLTLATVLAAPVAAQQVQPCGNGGDFPFETTAMAIAEPWEANTRSFADGDIRIAVMDTWEPALGAYYLMVLFWSGADTEADIRYCSLVSNGSLGFVSMTLDGLTSRYDPALGLVLSVPTTFYNPSDDELEEGVLEVVLNRKTLEVSATRP